MTAEICSTTTMNVLRISAGAAVQSACMLIILCVLCLSRARAANRTVVCFFGYISFFVSSRPFFNFHFWSFLVIFRPFCSLFLPFCFHAQFSHFLVDVSLSVGGVVAFWRSGHGMALAADGAASSDSKPTKVAQRPIDDGPALTLPEIQLAPVIWAKLSGYSWWPARVSRAADASFNISFICYLVLVVNIKWYQSLEQRSYSYVPGIYESYSYTIGVRTRTSIRTFAFWYTLFVLVHK